jgi:hypothetical protein
VRVLRVVCRTDMVHSKRYKKTHRQTQTQQSNKHQNNIKKGLQKADGRWQGMGFVERCEWGEGGGGGGGGTKGLVAQEPV